MDVWEVKAHEVISSLAFAAWSDANPVRRGRRPKRTRAYSIPTLAERLVAALGIHDKTEREHTTKALLLHHNYLITARAGGVS